MMTTLLLAIILNSNTIVNAGCADEYDCSLNGICNKTSSECMCDAQWYGEYCDMLRILPTIKNNGYREPNISSWGGSIIYDKATDTFHMFLARMSLNCGLTSWKTNSEVAHAVSSNNILGPYMLKDIVLPVFAHNPTIHYFNDTYYLYHIGCGHNTTIPISDCTNGTTPKQQKGLYDFSGDACDGPHWTGLLHSTSINGPWTPYKDSVQIITNRTGNWTTNPSLVMLSNGTIVFVYRNPASYWPYVYPPNSTSERLGISVSTSPYMFNGPFLDMTPIEPIQNYALEDDYIWQDFRGNFHMVTHKKKAGYGPNDGTGGHLFSKDGINWNVSRNSPYNNTIYYEDGSTDNVNARCRPQLVIEDGRVHYVSTGVKWGHDTGDYTFTVVQPVYFE